MGTYRFHIGGSKPFHDGDGAALPNAEAAWDEALRVLRDVEGTLRPGEGWSLEVVENGRPIFRIKLASDDLRSAGGRSSR